MKIGIIGVGALGTLFGSLLMENGHDVSLIHYRDEFAERLNENNVNINSEITDLEFVDINNAATTNAESIGTVDIVFVFVKSNQTKVALRQHSDCIGEHTDIVSLQNGLKHPHKLSEFQHSSHIFTGITRQSVIMESPGELTYTRDGITVIGGENDNRSAEIAKLLSDSNIKTKSVSNPQDHIWRKQLSSLPIKPIAGLTRLPNDQLINEYTLPIMKGIVQEGIKVAERKNISVSFDEIWDDVENACGNSHKSSMLQDIEGGRVTEINDINGAIVDYANEEGIPAPYNKCVTALINTIDIKH